MSDSELSEASHTPVPPDHELEQSLRREVVKVGKTGEDVTIKRIRTASEKRLGLPEGFYKSNETWNAKSKEIVHDQLNNEPEIPRSPVMSKTKKPAKQQSQEQAGPSKKKQKTESEESEAELSSPLSEIDSLVEAEETPKKSKKPRKPVEKKPSTSKKPAKKDVEEGENGAADSDDDLSSVIDDEPKPRRKSKGRDSQEPKSKKTKTTKSKAATDEDPDQAEIKRLQGWLVKCGIRKVWGKELKPFETPKAKIKHLKDMLTEAGMAGRYSVEKASQIKEARELAADIEAVQEGEKQWGTGDKDAEEEEERPQRRLVRGSKNYDFLSSDGEETD